MNHIQLDTDADVQALQRKYGESVGRKVWQYYESQMDNATSWSDVLDQILMTQFDSMLGPTRTQHSVILSIRRSLRCGGFKSFQVQILSKVSRNGTSSRKFKRRKHFCKRCSIASICLNQSSFLIKDKHKHVPRTRPGHIKGWGWKSDFEQATSFLSGSRNRIFERRSSSVWSSSCFCREWIVLHKCKTQTESVSRRVQRCTGIAVYPFF